MNKQIAELKTQCIVREQRGTSAFDSYMVDRFDTEKFAELIVRECSVRVDHILREKKDGGGTMGDEIREHFGVK
jgi:hypothetical protein